MYCIYIASEELNDLFNVHNFTDVNIIRNKTSCKKTTEYLILFVVRFFTKCDTDSRNSCGRLFENTVNYNDMKA